MTFDAWGFWFDILQKLKRPAKMMVKKEQYPFLTAMPVWLAYVLDHESLAIDFFFEDCLYETTFWKRICQLFFSDEIRCWKVLLQDPIQFCIKWLLFPTLIGITLPKIPNLETIIFTFHLLNLGSVCNLWIWPQFVLVPFPVKRYRRNWQEDTAKWTKEGSIGIP